MIPVRGSPRHLKECLAAISAQRPPYSFEVIVVDNGASSDVSAIVKTFAGVRLVRADRKTGSYYARNMGLAAARGEYLFFTDAGVLVPPGWLPESLDAKMYGGAVRFCSSDVLLDLFFRAGGQRGDVTGGRLFGGNMGYHREVFDEQGPFREVQSGEDHRFSMEAMTRHALGRLSAVRCRIDDPLEFIGKMYKYGKGTPCAYPLTRAHRKLWEVSSMRPSLAAFRVLSETAYLTGYIVGRATPHRMCAASGGSLE